ncbi:MAG: glutamine-hydrolyzing carbamoyl-phosphate synthase small subunit [Candidatus Omnitrophota bacterium]|nr:glutamine-hydrolyzing carbamoyl-phosphate synthase small subunit [Candidatus Omnitrophota bacterium]
MKKAVLALEKGSIFKGRSIGLNGEKTGRVSFYTGVVGYQEVMTSPANAGKIIVLTYPLIGNYGVAKKFMESKKVWAEAVVIKEKATITSNWQAEGDFDRFLEKEEVLAIEGIDTRTLMVELRENGEQFGIISTRDFNPKSLKKKIEKLKFKGLDVIKDISVKKITRSGKRGLTIGVIDIGLTNSIVSQLETLGWGVKVFPYNISGSSLLKNLPKAVIISDGPEADKGIYIAVEKVKQLLGKVPVLGIGAGCQVLALALGGRVESMFLGHHGLNYPVLSPGSLKGEITVQNHSYAINESSLKGKNVKIAWRNINDETIEGIECRKLKAWGYQFYPASPGMGEVNCVLKNFITSVKKL